jgi:hypothetical protein
MSNQTKTAAYNLGAQYAIQEYRMKVANPRAAAAEGLFSGIGKLYRGVRGGINPAQGSLAFGETAPGWVQKAQDLYGGARKGLAEGVKGLSDKELQRVMLARNIAGVAGGAGAGALGGAYAASPDYRLGPIGLYT